MAMEIKDLKIGAKLEIHLIDKFGKNAGYNYTSLLLDIVDESNIIIAYPMRKSRLVFIPTESRVEIVLSHKNHGLLVFEGTVTARSDKENLAALHIKVDTELQRIQRRQYFRLICYLDVAYRLLDDKNIENGRELANNNKQQKNEDLKYKKAVSSDLSGSGICIVTDEKLSVGSNIEVLISLDGRTSVKAICRVIRSLMDENNSKTRYKTGMHFVEISKHDRDLIIKYLFNLQRELIKKGFLKK